MPADVQPTGGAASGGLSVVLLSRRQCEFEGVYDDILAHEAPVQRLNELGMQFLKPTEVHLSRKCIVERS